MESPVVEEIEEERTAQYWADLATSRHQKEAFRSAIKFFRRAIAIEPENLNYRLDYGVSLARNEDLDEAIQVFNEILDDEPRCETALEYLGIALCLWGSRCGSAGWFSHKEAGYLYRLVQAIENPKPVIVELGSCFGLSSMIIARALKIKKEAKIYCVDAWEGDGSSVFAKTREHIQEQARLGKSFFEIFKENTQKAGVWEQLTPIQAYTTEVVKDWSRTADLIFVDADHSYEGVRRDVMNWKEHVRLGGLLLMHDVERKERAYENDSGPALVVDEFLHDKSGFAEISLIDTLYLTERIKE